MINEETFFLNLSDSHQINSQEFWNCADIRILPRNKTLILDQDMGNQTNITLSNDCSEVNHPKFFYSLLFIIKQITLKYIFSY